ncbi:hypothetical protein PYCCODRAFT_1066797 [Trametes coccinea BRFM310]|uniref:Uncharacterized protein n=1 Tax=Trametes coccinea (strain BRFM310) TaxID=1353009 RepID=A0A1Y2IZG1_TRAC3|nr:hypothetical protein PYCCODRAFT_1066797 [Trametes coccinea BRFM310]
MIPKYATPHSRPSPTSRPPSVHRGGARATSPARLCKRVFYRQLSVPPQQGTGRISPHPDYVVGRTRAPSSHSLSTFLRLRNRLANTPLAMTDARRRTRAITALPAGPTDPCHPFLCSRIQTHGLVSPRLSLQISRGERVTARAGGDLARRSQQPKPDASTPGSIPVPASPASSPPLRRLARRPQRRLNGLRVRCSLLAVAPLHGRSHRRTRRPWRRYHHPMVLRDPQTAAGWPVRPLRPSTSSLSEDDDTAESNRRSIRRAPPGRHDRVPPRQRGLQTEHRRRTRNNDRPRLEWVW